MNLNPLSLIETAIDKIFPDKDVALKHKTDLYKIRQQGQFKELDAFGNQVSALSNVDIAQTKINAEDAKNKHWFQSGYRPAAAWVCVLGLAYSPVVALLSWVLQVVGFFFNVDLEGFPMPPQIAVAPLIGLLVGILGLSTQRLVEKNMIRKQMAKLTLPDIELRGGSNNA